MPVEINIRGDNSGEALSELRGLSRGLLTDISAAEAASEAIVPAAVGPAPDQQEKAEPPKRGRGRPRKNPEPEVLPVGEADDPAETTPEEAIDVSEPPTGGIFDDEDDCVAPEDTVPLDEPRFPANQAGLKAAMEAYMAKFGVAELQKNKAKLLGHPKFSAVPESDFAAAIERIVAAIDSDQAGGA